MRRLLWIIVSFALLYSAAWFGLAKGGAYYADRWMVQQAQRGRVWACPSREISGFPLGLYLSCVDPQLTVTSEAGSSVYAAKGLRANIEFTSPLDADVILYAPVTAKLKGGELVTLGAASLTGKAQMHVAGMELALRSLRLTADTPDVTMSAPAGKALAAKATRAVASLERRGAAGNDFDVALDVDGARIPELEAFTQVAAPAALHIGGILSNLALPGSGDIAERLEQWRKADGLLNLAPSTVSNGTTQVEISGPLGLDAEHRAAGKLALKLQGANALLQRFGVPANMLNVGNLLGGLLGKPKKPEPEPEAGSIRLPLTLQGGKVQVGPLALPLVLQPLY